MSPPRRAARGRGLSHRSRSRRRIAAGAALAAAAALAPIGLSVALADAVDPLVARPIVVGPPRGFAPAERVDAARSGRGLARLPFPPGEAWRRHVSGSIEHPPVVDAQGNVLVALALPEVVSISAAGTERWRTRIGASAATAPPALTSDGTLVVPTAGGQIVGLDSAGRIRFAAPLGVPGRDLDGAPLATDDGGLVLAAGRTLLAIDGDGVVRARARLEERAVGAVVASPRGPLVTGESGTVYAWSPPGAPRKLGSFGGPPRHGAVLADARTLVAVVGGRSVVALDLPTSTTQVRSSAPSGGPAFDAPVAVSASGLTIVANAVGLLLGIDAAGNERVRVSLDKPLPAHIADGGLAFFGGVDLKPSPPLVVDPEGRIAFARASGRVGVVSPEGNVAVASERLCATPVAIQPAGDRRLLVACRDGTLWMLAEPG